MAGVITAVLALLSALIPVLAQWLEVKLHEADKRDPLSERHDRELQALAAALETGGGDDVAAAWDEHDRMLALEGLSSD